jgi:hypothetical protein
MAILSYETNQFLDKLTESKIVLTREYWTGEEVERNLMRLRMISRRSGFL